MPSPPIKLNIGAKGLNADTSPFTLPPENWNEGLNLRIKDGSVQTVPKLEALNLQPVTLNPLSICYYPPDGATYLNNIVVGLNTQGKLESCFTTNASASNANPTVANIPFPVGISSTYNPRYGIDSFIFNGLHILNCKNTLPISYNANAQLVSYKTLPDWITTTRVDTTLQVTGISEGKIILSGSPSSSIFLNSYLSNSDTYKDQYRVTQIVGNEVYLEGTSNFAVGNKVWVAHPYFARGMTQYQGRLIAFNLYSPVNPSSTTDDQYSPIEIAWSQPITSLQSLNGVVWSAAATNSAGNDYLTESPGEVLSALELNEYLVAYKNDSVYIYSDQGTSGLVAKTLYKDDGILNNKCVVPINSQQHFVVGNKSIYIHQGGVDKRNISRGRIEEAFFNNLDRSNKGLTFLFHNIYEKEVWVCFRNNTVTSPSATTLQGAIGCNRAYCYNYITDTWYLRSLPFITDLKEMETYNSFYQIAAQPSTTGAPLYLSQIGKEQEEIAFIQFDNRDLGNSAMTKDISTAYPHTRTAIGLQLKLTNYNTTVDWTTVTDRYFSPTNLKYKVDFRETGRYVHLRLNARGATSIDTTVVNPTLAGLDIDVELQGRR